MNIIPPWKIVATLDFLNEGFSNREISRQMGIHKDNVAKIRAQARRDIGMTFMCKCGQEGNHKGWCSHRYSMSEKRQDFINKWTNNRKPYILISERKPIPESIKTISSGTSININLEISTIKEGSSKIDEKIKVLQEQKETFVKAKEIVTKPKRIRKKKTFIPDPNCYMEEVPFGF